MVFFRRPHLPARLHVSYIIRIDNFLSVKYQQILVCWNVKEKDLSENYDAASIRNLVNICAVKCFRNIGPCFEST